MHGGSSAEETAAATEEALIHQAVHDAMAKVEEKTGDIVTRAVQVPPRLSGPLTSSSSRRLFPLSIPP